jgi:excisionase family DNA binding protein
MARHSGFEPLAFGSGGGRSTSAAVGSPSQAVGIIRVGPAGGVHPSHPVAPVSRSFTAGLLPRFPVDALARRAESPIDGRSGDGNADRPPLAAVPRAPERYLTVREVAERLRVSTATVYAAVRRSEIPHVRVSNAIRIPASALP